MALWLFGCTAFQFHPRTPFGVQCPTARVQTVKVAVRNCCGHIVGYKTCAPKPGEKSFVQCRCAEKTAAQHGASLPPKLEPFLSEPARVELPAIQPEPSASVPLRETFASVSFPPSVRPPDAV